jgi:hypothetical protein
MSVFWGSAYLFAKVKKIEGRDLVQLLLLEKKAISMSF